MWQCTTHKEARTSMAEYRAAYELLHLPCLTMLTYRWGCEVSGAISRFRYGLNINITRRSFLPFHKHYEKIPWPNHEYALRAFLSLVIPSNITVIPSGDNTMRVFHSQVVPNDYNVMRAPLHLAIHVVSNAVITYI